MASSSRTGQWNRRTLCGEFVIFGDKLQQLSQKPRKKMIAASHFDNLAVECPRTEQEHYPERTGICPRLERYCHSLGQPRRPEILPRSVADAGLRWCGGATPLSTERRIPNVKGYEEIIICFHCSPRYQKSLTAGL